MRICEIEMTLKCVKIEINGEVILFINKNQSEAEKRRIISSIHKTSDASVVRYTLAHDNKLVKVKE